MQQRGGPSTDHGAPGVALVASSFACGPFGHPALDLARGARAAGWRAILVGPAAPIGRETALTGADRVAIEPGARGWWAARRGGRRLDAALRAAGIDVVHTHDAAAHRLVAGLGRRDAAWLAGTSGGDGPAATAGVAAADRTVAASEWAAEETRASRIPPPKVDVVHAWVDLDRFDPAAVRGHRVAAIAERWGVPAGPRILVLPDRLARDRGHETLLRALGALGRRDIVLLVLGELEPTGREVTRLARDLRAAGLADSVRFGRAADDLPAALALADLVIDAPPRPEPSIHLAAAAQAMGKPVIVTDAGALGEAVMPSVTGWFVAPGDATELARALDLALGLPEDVRDRVAPRARAFARERFDARLGVARTLDLYRRLLRREPARSPAPIGLAARHA